MLDKGIVLSKLIEESRVVNEVPIIINEKPFMCFARATSVRQENKCLCISNDKYLHCVDDSTNMVITNQFCYDKLKGRCACGFCITDQPRGLFFQLMNEYEVNAGFNKQMTRYGKDCKISKHVSIADYGVNIGANVVIDDFVQIGPNVTIGDGVIIQAGAKIGVQAFNIYEYAGNRVQLFHNGKVIIGNNVLIGPNTIVQQALYRYAETKIGSNTKIDGNVLIGHNSDIGQQCIITAGCCIAGFVTIGQGAILRVNAIVRNGISIGENAHIGMGSVIVRRVRKGSRMFGNPAKDLERI